MIVSISRRTDIPAFYTDWLIRRLEEGFVLSQNPMNPRQLRRVGLSPEEAQCLVFWSKNPAPLLERLDVLKGRAYYFQFTLNAYGAEIEKGLPPLSKRVETFKRLADRAGPDRVVWRYDPILVNENYPAAFHEEAYGSLARALKGCSDTSVISFVDFYPTVAKKLRQAGVAPLPAEEMSALAGSLTRAARENGFSIGACAEETDLSAWGVGQAHCIDGERIRRITGLPLDLPRDKNQRPACGCVESVDIGVYNSCRHGCLYCYACRSPKRMGENLSRFDPASPLLCGEVNPPPSATGPGSGRRTF